MSHRNIPELFSRVVEHNSDKIAYRYKVNGRWVDMSWKAVGAMSQRIARALISLGVEPGTSVTILSQTRLEWIVSDYGIASCGGVVVGIYPSNLGPDCAYIVNHCEAQVLIVENAEQFAKIEQVRGDMPKLRTIVVIDEAGVPCSGSVLSWGAFLARADETPAAEVARRSNIIELDDLLSLVYTSGTTGVPKGVMLTHRNLLAVTQSLKGAIYAEPHFETLLFLPLAHVFARLIAYMCMREALTVNFAEDIRKVVDNLQEARPHFIASVPRIYEKVYDKVLSSAAAAGGIKKALFDWSLGVGLEVSRLKQANRPVPLLLGIRHRIADRLVLGKIRAAFGDRLVYSISGAAPLNTTIAEFFHACGVLVLEGIGMTENSSFTHVNRIGNNRFGTVGQPGPGIEAMIAEDGELLTRGENTMKGYFKDPDATAEVIDGNGWLHTGDVGEIDDQGFLRITDRKKDLIITAGGKNVAPQRIERILRTSPFIGHVMAYGDRRQFISALVTLDPDAIPEWAIQHGLGTSDLDALAEHPRTRELLEAEIAERNRQLASFESVKKFHILARDFSIETGELTPTLKIKRKVVVEKYRAELDGMYEDSAPA